MDAKDLFREGASEANTCVQRVELEQMTNATPCKEWDLRTLLNHMVYELAWVPDLLEGKTVKEVGNKYDGDLLGDDPVAAWEKYSEAALAAVDKAKPGDTVHLSYGDVKADHYIREVGSDILIHGWDVGQSINCSMTFSDKVVLAIEEFVNPRAKEYRASGLFGDQLPTKESDSKHVKLLAFFGRKEQEWQGE